MCLNGRQTLAKRQVESGGLECRLRVTASSEKTAGFGVPSFVPKWRARRDSNVCCLTSGPHDLGRCACDRVEASRGRLSDNSPPQLIASSAAARLRWNVT